MAVVVGRPSLQCGVQVVVRRPVFTSLAALLCLFALAGAAGAQESAKGLSEDQVVKLLRGGDPPARVQYLVNKYGIAFPLTAETEKELTQAGATKELLELVRKLAPPSPAAPPPLPQPSPPLPPPPSVLIINAKPGEAEVYVDDERRGQTSPEGVLKVSGLTAGPHKLRLSREGYQSFELPVELVGGQTDTVVAALQPVPAPAPSPKPPTPAEDATTAHAQPPPDPNDPMAPHDPGIYYIQQNAGSRRMIPLEPAPLGNRMSGAKPLPMSRPTWKSTINGGQAHVRIKEARPTFYFYLPPAVSSAGFSAMSPREFVLAHLESKKNEREVPLEKAHSMAGPRGIRPKDTISFTYDKVASGIYRVQPDGALSAGEYGFVYAGSVQMEAGRLFDFGIEGAK